MRTEARETNQLTNRPTESVVRWLSEDEASAQFWRCEAFSLCSELGAIGIEDPEMLDRAGRQLAKRLKEDTQDASPLRGVGPYGELVNAAIEEVDWYGVAQSLIGFVCNEVGAAYRVDTFDGGGER